MGLGSSVAFAQGGGGGETDEKKTKKVLQLIRSGNDHYDNEEYEKAYGKYTEAYDLYPDPALLVRLGKTAEKLEKYRDAVMYYQKYIDANPKDQTARNLSKRLPDLKEKLPPLIRVESEPAGASIYRGEVTEANKLGETPGEVEVEPGKVTIIITKEGYSKVTKRLEVEKGSTTTLPVDLEEAEEGRKVAETDAEESDRDVDTLPGDDEVGEPADLDEPSEGKSDTNLAVWGYSTLGVGVATLATGTVFAVLTQGAESDVNNYDKRAPGASRSELQDLKDQANSYYRASVVSFVAGGVLTATGAGILTYHFLTAEDDGSKEASIRLNGGVMPGSGGWVGLSGRF